jgi:hypothetical protein
MDPLGKGLLRGRVPQRRYEVLEIRGGGPGAPEYRVLSAQVFHGWFQYCLLLVWYSIRYTNKGLSNDMSGYL